MSDVCETMWAQACPRLSSPLMCLVQAASVESVLRPSMCSGPVCRCAALPYSLCGMQHTTRVKVLCTSLEQ